MSTSAERKAAGQTLAAGFWHSIGGGHHQRMARSEPEFAAVSGGDRRGEDAAAQLKCMDSGDDTQRRAR